MLKYLATEESFRSLSFAFRISFSYISVLAKKTLAIKKETFNVNIFARSH